MNKRITGIYILLFISLASMAQKERVENVLIQIADSLLNETEFATNDIDYERVKQLSHKALALSENVEYHQGMVRAYYIIGQALFYQNNYNEALSFLSRADNMKDSKKYPLYMAQIHNLRGRIYCNLDMNDQALKEYLIALEKSDKIADADNRGYVRSQIYVNISNSYRKLDDMDASFKYMEKNLKLLDGMDESFVFQSKIELYSSLGEYYSIVGDMESAEYYIHRSLEMIDMYDYKHRSKALINLGDLYLQPSNLELALATYSEALDNASELGIRSEMLSLHEKIAEVYNQLDMTDSASVHLDEKIINENLMLREKMSSTDSVLAILINEEKVTSKAEKKKQWELLLLSLLYWDS